MQQSMLAVIVVVSLLVAGNGIRRAAAQMPQCDPGRDGAAPAQHYGTAADVAAKKRADAEKYRSAEANSAAQACSNEHPQDKDGSFSQK